MIRFLVLQVLLGAISIDKIPDEYREVVKKELEKLNGNS
jgi:hypothetical protein